MFVRSGIHEVVVARHIREAGLDGQIPVVRQRQSFLPPFKKKRSKTSLMFAGLLSTINSQLKAHLAYKFPDCFTIEVYMFQYTKPGSHNVSQMENLKAQKKLTR